jgi:glycosyltransferase involved in cell wall biosynthesis
MENPLVSVLFITYNHAKYVRQALESILIQKTTFPFQIIIGDDCSADGTREIMLEIAAQYPQKIILNNPEKNLGAARNFIQLFDACVNSKAKYISYLEGDDYWTDEYKLQKQVDFMESNAAYSMCFAKARVLKERESKVTFHLIPKTDTLYFSDILFAHYIPTLTILFRNNLQLPGWYVQARSGDRALAMLLTIQGPAKFMNEYMGVYRVHEGGITNTVNQNKKVSNEAYFMFKHLLPHAGLKQKITLLYIIIKNRTASYLRAVGLMRK